ncbi:hypothetical protein [Parafrankia sp. EUN1f]|uniref:hypothetical protein n=1 Tax=Parafrankia sp. EUN1f TaxID=102897 RepID=UPI0005673E7D|nr:hypothetical protein [Parafrankia sp. EUN1f]
MDTCPLCGEPEDDHELLADFEITIDTTEGPMLVPGGGRVCCPVEGSPVRGTWSLGIPEASQTTSP